MKMKISKLKKAIQKYYFWGQFFLTLHYSSMLFGILLPLILLFLTNTNADTLKFILILITINGSLLIIFLYISKICFGKGSKLNNLYEYIEKG